MKRFKLTPSPTDVRICITTNVYKIMTDLYISSHPLGQSKRREPYVEATPFQTGIKTSMKVIPLFFEKKNHWNCTM